VASHVLFRVAATDRDHCKRVIRFTRRPAPHSSCAGFDFVRAAVERLPADRNGAAVPILTGQTRVLTVQSGLSQICDRRHRWIPG
jgi:hypothetical protein